MPDQRIALVIGAGEIDSEIGRLSMQRERANPGAGRGDGHMVADPLRHGAKARQKVELRLGLRGPLAGRPAPVAVQETLSADESARWQDMRRRRLETATPATPRTLEEYFAEIAAYRADETTSAEGRIVLDQLDVWGRTLL